MTAPSTPPPGDDPGARVVVPPGNTPRMQQLKRAVRLLFGGLSVVFVLYAVRRLVGQWDAERLTVQVVPLVLAVLALVASVIVQAIGWRWLLMRMSGSQVPFRPAIFLHLESQLARYTPGKLGMPLVRMAGADALKAPASTIGASVVVEAAPHLAIGGAVGFLGLWLTAKTAEGPLSVLGSWGLWGVAAFAVATLLLVAVDRRRFPARALRLIGVSGSGPLVPLRVPLVFVAYWGLWFLHGYLISLAVGIDSSTALAGAGLFVIAPIVGFLAVVTPAGVGVREAVISVGLLPLAGPVPAVGAAVASRLASLGVDLLAWVVARWVGAR